MQLYPFRATLPKLEFITSPEAFFGSVKEDFLDYASSGFFNTSSESAFYIYRIGMGSKIFSGLVACLDMNETQPAHVVPHEQTLATKEQKQIHLLLKRKATVKPVLLTYEAVDKINFTLHEMSQKKPLLEVTFPGEHQVHTLWAIETAEEKAKIEKLFQDRVTKTYIADGHHRCATAHRLSSRDANTPFRKVLCALFPSSDLEIHDFNRVIDAFTDCTSTYFMAKLSQYCDIEFIGTPFKPRKKHELMCFIQGEWYRLSWKEKVFAQLHYDWNILDTQLFNDIILNEILKITDVSNNPRIHYVEGPKGLDGLRRKTLEKSYRIGFALYPVQTQELFNLADHQIILPPKSTWFEPRLKNGLINLKYDFG